VATGRMRTLLSIDHPPLLVATGRDRVRVEDAPDGGAADRLTRVAPGGAGEVAPRQAAQGFVSASGAPKRGRHPKFVAFIDPPIC
jgi:hypothetical protein